MARDTDLTDTRSRFILSPTSDDASNCGVGYHGAGQFLSTGSKQWYYGAITE